MILPSFGLTIDIAITIEVTIALDGSFRSV